MEGVAFDFVVNDPGKRLFNLQPGWQPSQKGHLHTIDDRQVTDACDQDGKYQLRTDRLHQNAASCKNTYYRNIGHGAEKQPLAGPVEYLTKGVHQYAGLEDGSVHTLDFLSLVLLGELKVELNVSFPRASALNHSGLCNKATVVGVGSEIAPTP